MFSCGTAARPQLCRHASSGEPGVEQSGLFAQVRTMAVTASLRGANYQASHQRL